MKKQTRLGLLATALVTMMAPVIVMGMSASAQASDSPPWNTKAPYLSIGASPVTSANEYDQLTCNRGEWQAGDGDAVTQFEYRYYRDSSLLLGSSQYYTVTAADKGHSLTCRVRAATADSDFSSEHTTAPVTVAGSTPPPSGDSGPSLASWSAVSVYKHGAFLTGYHSLTCQPGTWLNADDADVYYAWTRDGSPIEGADEDTYLTTALDSRAKIACLVAMDNGYATSGFAQSAPVMLPKYKGTPVNRTAPTVSGTAKVGKVLTCNPGTWFNAKTYAYRWYYSSNSASPGVAGTLYSNGKTLTLTANDVNNYYYCAVAASPPAGGWGGPSSYVTSSNRSGLVVL